MVAGGGDGSFNLVDGEEIAGSRVVVEFLAALEPLHGVIGDESVAHGLVECPGEQRLQVQGVAVAHHAFLSYIPNCIGSYTHDLYQAEALQITDKFEEVQELIHKRDTIYHNLQAQADVAHAGTMDPALLEATMEQTGVDEVIEMEKDASKLWFTSLTSGAVVLIDKFVMVIALIIFRIGWWSTIYCQQILLGMLTIFGPIQWAFSLLPKWEGAWAKWITRYLTVHFYGAMLFFVGFYVLLLFDIVLCIQVENLTAITASETTMAAYLQNSFFSAGYLMAASIVALKCLNLVPDLAAWMIPEGDTAFSTRNFGEGVAQQAKISAVGAMKGIF